MGAHHLGPEFSNAPCNVIRIAVKVLHGLERNRLARGAAGEHGKVHLHTVGESPDQPAHPGPVIRLAFQIETETVLQPRDERGFAGILLARNQCGLDGSDFLPVNAILGKLGPELLEEQQPPTPVNQLRVGDRVGCSREQVGQPHLVPDTAGHHDQGQIERARDLLEDRTEQLTCAVSRVRCRSHYLTSKRPSMPFSRWLAKNSNFLSQ